MKKLLVCLLLSLLVACEKAPRETFDLVLSKTKGPLVVQVVDLQKPTSGHVLSAYETVGFFKEMRKIERGDQSYREPRYVFQLYSDTSLKTQVMKIDLDEKGKGYFEWESNRAGVYFKSEPLVKWAQKCFSTP
ncbi:MAG: hypothetical protein QM680_01560 [Luteolibacter sp.]